MTTTHTFERRLIRVGLAFAALTACDPSPQPGATFPTMTDGAADTGPADAVAGPSPTADGRAKDAGPGDHDGPPPPPGDASAKDGSTTLVPGPVKKVTFRSVYDQAQGVLGGHGEQSHCSASQNGERIFIVGDMNGSLASINGGALWQPRRCEGLFYHGGLSVKIHPDDANRVFVVGNSGVTKEDGHYQRAGLYRSRDGGETFELVIETPNSLGPNHMFYFATIQHNMQWIDFSAGDTDKGWALIQQRAANYGNQSAKWDNQQAGLWRTTDGGDSWKDVIPWLSMNKGDRGSHRFGLIYLLKVDPKDPDRIYLGCEAGLFTAKVPGSGTLADQDFTKLAGAMRSRAKSSASTSQGLLHNKACRSLWIAPDGKLVYYTIDHEGLYRGTSGVQSATLRYDAYARPNNDGRVYQVAVSPVKPTNLWLFRGTRGDKAYRDFAPRFSTDGGKSFTDCDDGFENGKAPIHQKMTGEAAVPMPSPTSATTCIVSRGQMYATFDGINFQKYSDGWNGASIQSIAFHPGNTEDLFIGATDTGFWLSHDSGETWRRVSTRGVPGHYPPKPPNPNNFIGRAAAITPDGSYIGAVAATAAGSAQLSRWYYQGGKLQQAFPDGETLRAHWHVEVDADGKTVYATDRRSNNGGVSFGPGIGTPAGASGWRGVAAATTTPGTIWGIASSQQDGVVRWYRSTNRGTTWALVASETDQRVPRATDAILDVRPHPTDDSRAFVHSRTEVFLIGTGGVKQPLGFRTFSTSFRADKKPLSISKIAVDRNDPKIVYVGVGDDAGRPALFITTDGGKTWADATGYTGDPKQEAFIPAYQCNALAVHPLDGTLIWGGRATGAYARRPPAGYTAAPGHSPGQLFDAIPTSADFTR